MALDTSYETQGLYQEEGTASLTAPRSGHSAPLPRLARVLEVDDSVWPKRLLCVEVASLDQTPATSGQVTGQRDRDELDEEPFTVIFAIPSGTHPQIGDGVLFVDSTADRFALGHFPANEPPPVETLSMGNGDHLQIDREQGRVRLQDAAGSTRLTYNMHDRSVTLSAVSGDLNLESVSGNVRLVAAQQVELTGRAGVEVRTPRLSLVARLAEWRGEHFELMGGSLRFVAGRADWVIENITQVARRMVTQVAELSQLRAKRVRVTAAETAETRAGKVKVNADQDVSIDGSRVHLG